ncbi:MAG TPA: EAL domain-containing protein [Thermoanaerobaculia bacterium]|nr:EAL domain-containing protein [Thermoanaerobaculia bacterium]
MQNDDIFRLIVDSLPDGLGVCDAEGRLVYVNERFAALLGYPRDEVQGRSCADFLDDANRERLELELDRRRHGDNSHYEIEAITRDGGRITTLQMPRGLFDAEGKFVGSYAVVSDVAERKQAERALRESEERYHGLFEGVPVGLYRTTPAGVMLDANSTLVKILGFPDLQTLLKANVGDLYQDPEDRRRWQRVLVGASTAQSFEARVRRFDGTVIWVRFTVRAVRGDEGEILRYDGALEDITDRHRAEEALRSSEERFRSLVQNASDLICILDAEGIVRYESPSHRRVLGMDAEPHLGRGLPELVHPEDRTVLENALRRLVQEPGEIVTFEYRLLHGDGGWRSLESTASNLLGQPAVAGIVLNAHDITDHKKAEAKLLHDALHDELTGLPNRALFMDRLRHSMERSRREPELLTAVLFLDLDRFKIVNDSLGHLVGDELLIQISGSLAGALRPSDTIARVGGDEFAILLEGGRDVSDAVRVAERIHDRLTTAINLGGHEVFVTASIGIAVHTPEYERPEDLLRDADTAMYRAKSSGRACHVVFNRVMHRFVMARLQLETDLRRAVERGQLRVHYQPFVDLATDEVMGFEALVRWHHPRRGLLPPDEFLSVAEETGLIVPIGRFVLMEGCRQIRELQRKHPENGSLKLTVNLSNKQFFQADLFDQIAEALAASGLDPACLGLEITEGVIIRQADSASSRFSRLKSLGVQLYLDDFGKGFSSLSYLHRFPMDILKIDRSFVSRIEEAEGNFAIVKAIVTLAHQLGMEVVAEGIQTSDQKARLRGLGCEYGQGFFLSPAVPADEAEQLLMRRVRTAVP